MEVSCFFLLGRGGSSSLVGMCHDDVSTRVCPRVCHRLVVVVFRLDTEKLAIRERFAICDEGHTVHQKIKSYAYRTCLKNWHLARFKCQCLKHIRYNIFYGKYICI